MQIDLMLKNIPQRKDTLHTDMVWIDGGGFLMDTNYCQTVSGNTLNPVEPADGGSTSHHYQKVLKGGSFLCHASYCTGYRVARRSSNGWDTGSNHTGFRCMK